jgi:glycosyltransferase involved in cell wall biosynthesis
MKEELSLESTESLVSVIIPVYNGEAFLAEAISSVLAQNYEPLEIIVVDDGSTDGSAAVVKSYTDVRYIYQSNQGVASARNSGLSAAKGTFIAFLDADDTWPSRKLQIQVEYLREHPSVMFTISKINNFPDPGLNMEPQALQLILESDQIGLATIVARKAVFDQIGGFNPRYQVGEDLEWFTRAKDAGIPLVILPDVLLNRRIHNSNMSIKQPQACKAGRLQIMKESIDRQRKKKAGVNGTE